MIKKTIAFKTTIFISIFCTSLASYANDSWKINTSEQKVFIENIGQFDNQAWSNEPIEYGVSNLGVQIYFTQNGLQYKYEKTEKRIEDGKKYKGPEEEFEKIAYTLEIEWVGANPNSKIVATDKDNSFYSYLNNSGDGMLKANGYSKITYTDLYPNIDVEYIFHEKEGMKYTLLLKPGADPSAIKMKYKNHKNISLENGNIQVEIKKSGLLIDHAPVSFYEENKNEIKSSFALKGSTVGFELENYDNSKSILIDPWVINPAFSGNNAGYDIDKDSNGDVYVSGGTNPHYLKKYNSIGVLQWTYNFPNTTTYYGDFTIDKNDHIYIGYGAWIGNQFTKIDANSNLIFNNTSGNNSYASREIWRLSYVDVIDSLMGGGYGSDLNTIHTINPLNGNFTSVNAPEPGTEVRAQNSDSYGNTYALYLPLVSQSLDKNRFIKLDQGLNTVWNKKSHYTITETSPTFHPSNFTGFNGVVVGCFAYTYDGVKIIKWDKNTGDKLDSTSVVGGIAYMNGGIAVDKCGNVYVGSNDHIAQYDTAFTLIDTIQTPGMVIDVNLDCSGDLLACGNGFAAKLTANACTTSFVSSSNIIDASCTACDGEATIIPVSNSCDTSIYNYSWNTGDTLATITNVCAGNYTVTITDILGCVFDSSVVTITVGNSGGGGFTTDSVVVAETCNLCNATATANPSGGVSPYTYMWDSNANNQATQTATGLCDGSYTVTITDADTCINILTVIVDEVPVIKPNIGPDSLLCEGEAVTLDAGNGDQYFWSTTETTQAITVNARGDYYVVMEDSNGCDVSDTVTINYSILDIDLGPDRSKCTEDAVVLDAGNNAVTYQWDSGETTQINYVGTPGIYIVTVHDGGRCSKSDTITITKGETPFAQIEALPGVCEDVVLDVANKENLTYQWNTGETAHTITVFESGAYWVVLDNGECKNSDTMDVSIEYIEPKIIIPNVFTPNGDGFNDELKFVLPPTETYDLKIYNRWGRLLFETTNETNHWNGGDFTEGVYEYILVYKKLCGTQETVTETGYVTLLR